MFPFLVERRGLHLQRRLLEEYELYEENIKVKVKCEDFEKTSCRFIIFRQRDIHVALFYFY